MTKVLVPIANGTEDIEVVTIVDLLRRAEIIVHLAGLSEVVTCSRGIKIIPDTLLMDIGTDQDYDAIVLPGGLGGKNEFIDSNLLRIIIEKHYHKSGIIGAVCAAPAVLKHFGMINTGTKLTSHPSFRKELIEYDYLEESVVVDGYLVTSRGAGTTIEFTLKIIELLKGKALADKISGDIVFRSSY